MEPVDVSIFVLGMLRDLFIYYYMCIYVCTCVYIFVRLWLVLGTHSFVVVITRCKFGFSKFPTILR